MKNKNTKICKKGFTLIELLVVVAIIGILASVVLASLNSARQKGQIAAIKSNLRNMADQMELSYSDNGNYSGINPDNGSSHYPDTTCQSPIAGMAQAITNSGAKTRCLSYNYGSDVYQRWGATGLIYSGTTPPVQAWSATPAGVVTWDAQGVSTSGSFISSDTTMTWDQANTACATTGGRLPTLEELKTLADATCIAKNSAADCTVTSDRTPTGFVTNLYWSSTTVPSVPTTAYYVNFSNGLLTGYPKGSNGFVRCVR